MFRGILTQFVNAAAGAAASEHAPAHNHCACIALTGRIDNNNQLRVAGRSTHADTDQQYSAHNKKRIGNEHGALRLKPSTHTHAYCIKLTNNRRQLYDPHFLARMNYSRTRSPVHVSPVWGMHIGRTAAAAAAVQLCGVKCTHSCCVAFAMLQYTQSTRIPVEFRWLRADRPIGLLVK